MNTPVPRDIKLHRKSALLELDYGEQGSYIGLPQCLLIAAQLPQIAPAVQASVVTIVKIQANGIVTHRCHRPDLHIAFAGLQHFLATAMPPDFGRGGMHPQKLGAELVASCEH